MTTPNIDLHCHFIPPGLINRIESQGATHSVHLTSRGTVSFAGRDETQAIPAGMLDLDDREAWMDSRAIDVQVLSAWIDFSAYELDPEDGAWLARSLNELTVDALKERSERFRAMATVPLQAPDLAAEELRYAIEQLGMIAVEIATAVGDAELDEPALEPFWSAAEELDVLVLIHPLRASLGSGRLKRYFLDNIVGNPAEETVAAAHLIYGGVLQRHPGLKVCLTHGGGFLPYQIGRQDRGFAARSDVTALHVDVAPSDFLRRFYYDTVVHGAEALRFLVERVGADRVVLGSDYPFPMGDPDPVASARRPGFDDATTRAILGDNAQIALGGSLDRGGARILHRRGPAR